MVTGFATSWVQSLTTAGFTSSPVGLHRSTGWEGWGVGGSAQNFFFFSQISFFFFFFLSSDLVRGRSRVRDADGVVWGVGEKGGAGAAGSVTIWGDVGVGLWNSGGGCGEAFAGGMTGAGARWGTAVAVGEEGPHGRDTIDTHKHTRTHYVARQRATTHKHKQDHVSSTRGTLYISQHQYGTTYHHDCGHKYTRGRREHTCVGEGLLTGGTARSTDTNDTTGRHITSNWTGKEKG